RSAAVNDLAGVEEAVHRRSSAIRSAGEPEQQHSRPPSTQRPPRPATPSRKGRNGAHAGGRPSAQVSWPRCSRVVRWHQGSLRRCYAHQQKRQLREIASGVELFDPGSE
uniref:Uncharacterized protein n=1 Tax=Aegilops tauschii subsp. strangulata TaxID=200361 RepID=A0A453QM67_AEGTS